MDNDDRRSAPADADNMQLALRSDERGIAKAKPKSKKGKEPAKKRFLYTRIDASSLEAAQRAFLVFLIRIKQNDTRRRAVADKSTPANFMRSISSTIGNKTGVPVYRESTGA